MKRFICSAFIVCVLFIASMLCLSGCTPSTKIAEEPQVSDGRFISDATNCYVVTDTETGVRYLFCKSFYAGGLTVLVNSDGTPCIADGYEK